MASRVGKYLLFETLGEGAFGKVKLGVHEESGEQVAVKIMDKSDIKAQEMTMNVRREIAIMKALKHRNIVNLRQVLTSQSKLYIVMDLVTGGELFTKILNEGKLEETIARRYFQQLVDGIEYCHRRGVCHRDLKPENLLIDESTGELKITDFGLSAMKGASTTEELLHTQCGSPNYCAPEIIARHKQGYNGTKVDAWSCGIILFALLAGFLPFYDENTRVLYRMIQKDDVKFPRKFPPEAKDLVLKLLHKEPEERYTLAEVKKHPWFVIGYDGDDSAPRSGSRDSPPVSRRKKRGHSRKSSVDQAPRSRELVPRKKSDKSDNDSGTHSGSMSLPPIPPAPVQPTPPPVLDSGQPRSHRAQVPVSASPTAPRSPLPPLPPTPPSAPPMPLPAVVQPPQVPLPPPPPPPPPTAQAASTQYHANPANTRPAPPYAAAGVVRRKSREARDARQADGGSVGSVGSTGMPSAVNSTATSIAIPSYPSSDAGPSPQFPSPPPFPAPDLPPEPLDSQPAPQFPGWAGNGGRPVTNGIPPLPPGPFPPTRSGHARRAYLDAATSSALSSSKSYPEHLRVGNSDVMTSPTPNLPHEDPITFSPSQSIDLEPASASANLYPSAETSKSNPTTPKSGPRKWAVSGPAPRSYRSGAVAPVTTPAELASGDSSWQKFGTGRSEEKTQNTVKFNLRNETETLPAENPKEEPVPTAKPLSIVEQRRLLYNKMASDADPPLPDPSARRPVQTIASPVSTPVEPRSVPSRFSDRTDAPVMSGYPTDPKSGSAARYPVVDDLLSNPNGRLLEPTASTPMDENVHRARNEHSYVPFEPDAVRPITELPDEDVPEETHVENVGNTQRLRAQVTVLPDDDEAEIAPLKQRLAAALARYRRIFRLGNNIGITSSPSFSSNKSGVGEGSGEEDGKRASIRAEFFARAKAVTGAWGIILTQELDEDSDSEDEGRQVTEAELQAFSRLLDFWDNRRASASIPKDGEVVLDDDASSPLSDEDIISIQSLLQKLEPKQVEEEMTEVVEEAEGEGLMQVDAPPLGAAEGDDLQDLNVESLYIGKTDSTGAQSSGRAGPSERTVREKEGFNHVSDQGRYHSQPAFVRPDAPNPAGMRSSAKPVAPPPPPPPPPLQPFGVPTGPRAVPPPPPRHPGVAAVPAPPTRPVATNVASWDRGAASPTPPAPPPPPGRPVPAPVQAPIPPPSQNGVSTQTSPPAPPPPPYAAPESHMGVTDKRKLPVTPSTVRDPFRPRYPQSYPPGQSKGNGPVNPGEHPERERRSAHEPSSGAQRSARSSERSERSSRETDIDIRKRKSSTNASEPEKDDRKTITRDSGRVHSGASGVSEGTGGANRKGHIRSPSRDEHATRGMFTFGMFKRKNSTITSFDSKLSPEQCLNEIGGILTAMGCEVMVKRGESKLKCTVPMRDSKLMVSITCTQERRVSTVHFKKGKKDRSQVDAKQFFDFYRMVQSRFFERVGNDGRVRS